MTRRWIHLRIVLTRAAIAALILAGCATMQNTPKQEYVWEMGKICDGQSNTWYLDKVEPDGRYTVRGATNSTGGNIPYFDCMKEQFRAHPFPDWVKAQNREVAQPPAAARSVAAVASPPSTPVMAPVWQIGDEWQYAYKSPSGSGTFVWTVNRVESLDGVPHYVVMTARREILYRVSDLASSLERVDGLIVSRDIPSRLNYSFPLTVGKTWEQAYRLERPVDRTTADRNSLYSVDAEETVTVPAGTFRTLKITWRNKNTSAIFYEVWYAPDAKQWVKMREPLSNGIRERQMIAFKLKQS